MTLHQEIPLNKDRRHFVVGDIHGRYEAFLNLLDEINYDQSTDMIYSVGDLIDRGGRVAYQGGPGPCGFQPPELETAIQKLLDSGPAPTSKT